MKFEVGQLLYLLLRQDMKVILAQVVEEIVRKKIDGQEINYKIILPTKDRDVIDITDLDADIFTDADSIRSHMIKNASLTIDKLISRAETMAGLVPSQNKIEVSEHRKIDEDDVASSKKRKNDVHASKKSDRIDLT